MLFAGGCRAESAISGLGRLAEVPSLRFSGLVWPHPRPRFAELDKLRLQVRDHAAIVGAAANARRRAEDFQLPPHPGDRFVQLFAQGRFRVGHVAL